MTGLLTPTSELVAHAARVAVAHLVEGELAVEPGRDVVAFAPPASAVVVAVAGARNGSLTLVVADDAVAAGADPVTALRDAADVAARALETTVTGAPQVLDAALAVHAVLADPEATIVRITRGGTPVAVVAAKLAEAAPTVTAGGRGSLRDVDPERLHLLRGVEMAVTVEIGRTRLTVAELLGLTPGAVVELDRPAGAPADLLVNGRLIGRGEIVVVDETFALRVTEIVAADEER